MRKLILTLALSMLALVAFAQQAVTKFPAFNKGTWTFQTSAREIALFPVEGKETVSVYLVSKTALTGPAAIGSIQLNPYASGSAGWIDSGTWMTASASNGGVVTASLSNVNARRARFWATGFQTAGTVEAVLLAR